MKLINSCRIIGRFSNFGGKKLGSKIWFDYLIFHNVLLDEKCPQNQFTFFSHQNFICRNCLNFNCRNCLNTVRISSPNIHPTTYKEIRRTRALQVSSKKKLDSRTNYITYYITISFQSLRCNIHQASCSQFKKTFLCSR